MDIDFSSVKEIKAEEAEEVTDIGTMNDEISVIDGNAKSEKSIYRTVCIIDQSPSIEQIDNNSCNSVIEQINNSSCNTAIEQNANNESLNYDNDTSKAKIEICKVNNNSLIENSSKTKSCEITEYSSDSAQNTVRSSYKSVCSSLYESPINNIVSENNDESDINTYTLNINGNVVTDMIEDIGINVEEKIPTDEQLISNINDKEELDFSQFNSVYNIKINDVDEISLIDNICSNTIDRKSNNFKLQDDINLSDISIENNQKVPFERRNAFMLNHIDLLTCPTLDINNTNRQIIEYNKSIKHKISKSYKKIKRVTSNKLHNAKEMKIGRCTVDYYLRVCASKYRKFKHQIIDMSTIIKAKAHRKIAERRAKKEQRKHILQNNELLMNIKPVNKNSKINKYVLFPAKKIWSTSRALVYQLKRTNTSLNKLKISKVIVIDSLGEFNEAKSQNLINFLSMIDRVRKQHANEYTNRMHDILITEAQSDIAELTYNKKASPITKNIETEVEPNINRLKKIDTITDYLQNEELNINNDASGYEWIWQLEKDFENYDNNSTTVGLESNINTMLNYSNNFDDNNNVFLQSTHENIETKSYQNKKYIVHCSHSYNDNGSYKVCQAVLPTTHEDISSVNKYSFDKSLASDLSSNIRNAGIIDERQYNESIEQANNLNTGHQYLLDTITPNKHTILWTIHNFSLFKYAADQSDMPPLKSATVGKAGTYALLYLSYDFKRVALKINFTDIISAINNIVIVICKVLGANNEEILKLKKAYTITHNYSESECMLYLSKPKLFGKDDFKHLLVDDKLHLEIQFNIIDINSNAFTGIDMSETIDRDLQPNLLKEIRQYCLSNPTECIFVKYGEKTIKCSKYLLCLRAAKLRNYIKNNTDIIELKNIGEDIAEELLYFIHTNKSKILANAKIDDKQLYKLLVAAYIYECSLLFNLILDRLLPHVNKDVLFELGVLNNNKLSENLPIVFKRLRNNLNSHINDKQLLSINTPIRTSATI